MNRAVRNGLAIAGMAGGIFFLGQAAASADVENNTEVGQSAQATGTGSGTGAASGNYSEVENDTEIDVDNDADAGNSNTGNKVAVVNDTGGNDPSVVAGSGSGGHKSDGGTVHVSLEIDSSATNNLNVDSGNIAGSSNASIAGDAATAPSVTNNTHVDQTATSTSNNSNRHGFPWNNGSESGNESVVENDTEIDVDNEADAGNSNTGNVVIVENNTGDNDPKLFCWSDKGDVYCSITIDASVTNNITVNSGDICGSSNASIGGNPAYHCGTAAAPAAAQHHAAAKPAHQARPHAAPASHKAPVSRTAQPKGELAYTGAETTAPLALGLIALGAGGALTLAGRRRSSTAAV